MQIDFEALHQHGLISDLDLHFTRFIAAKSRHPTPELLLGACLASHWTGNGNVCVNLYGLAGQAVFETHTETCAVTAPPAKIWLAALRSNQIVGRPGEFKPLILDHQGRLYLYRYWDYERRLQKNLLARAGRDADDIDETRLIEDLARLFPPSEHQPNWQKLAAACAVLKRFCVISGGPGTGKTTTVVRILALLISQQSKNPPAIALAAPTGKAAARMQEAVGETLQRLRLDESISQAIPDQASTIHRLLGARADSVYFRHNSANPLPLDVLIVDEASMIDLALMTKLAEALPLHARLVLLGDKDQLASVEAGAVLGDICGPAAGFSQRFQQHLRALTKEPIAALSDDTAGNGDAPLNDVIVLLRHSYRFGPQSGIGNLAYAINQGEADAAKRVLQDDAFADVSWRDLDQLSAFADRVANDIVAGLNDYIRALQRDGTSAEIFTAFNAFRILCALRSGPFGVEEINRLVENLLHRKRLLRVRPPWYPGRPIMISRNDYNLRLYNGDIGITLPDPQNPDRLRVYFQTTDGGLRDLPPNRLPEHETVFAMTIHKSQGSEFDRIMMVLPAEYSRILTRELLYTGITRARESVRLWGDQATFSAAISRRLQRSSGLRDTLWA